MEEGERNYCCLALLLLRVGNPCLRRYFKQKWDAAGTYTCPWTDCPQNGADLLRMFKPLQYEKKTVKSGDTSQWDLSLLVKVLRYSRPPFVVAANLKTALETLKEMRNQLCHSPFPRVKATDFQKSWRDGCNALSLFGATVADFDKVEQDVKKPISELLEMMKNCADQDKAILEGLDLINCKLERLQLEQSAGQDRILQGHDKILQELSLLKKQDQGRKLESPLKGEGAGNVTYNITVKDHATAVVGPNASITSRAEGISDLLTDTEKDLSLRAQEYTKKLKCSVQKQTGLLTLEEDKKIRTDDIFTNLTIERGRKHSKEPQETRFHRRQMGEKFQASGEKLTNCSKMFLPPRGDGQKSSTSDTTANPKTILVTGKAGIGKSLFCQKLVRDWSGDRMFEEVRGNNKVPDFQFVFLLTFRQFSNPQQDQGDQKEELIDLLDFLNRSSLLDEQSMIDKPLLQYIIKNPEKLLVIIDGFDEYKQRKKIIGDFETGYKNDPYEKIPVPAMIAKIMKGQMLKGSVVLISSRPGEAEELKNIAFDVRCDIQGFSSPQVLEYIEKYFKENESMKKKVLDQVKTNEILLSFGHIPVMCFLMCYCIKWFITKTKTTENLPVTRTELYYEVIKLFIKKHSFSKYEEMEETKVQELMHKLGELAMSLTMEGKYIFDEAYLKKFKFNDAEITNLKASGLLDCCPGVRKSPAEKPPLEYTFTHLTIQEFLCAFLFVEKKQIPEKKKTSDVTFMFMAGLCCMKNDEKLMEELIENIKPKDYMDHRNKLLTLSCLYEYKDSKFSCKIIDKHKDRYCSRVGWIGSSFITDMDCLYISYLLNIVNLINEEQTKQHPTFTQSFIVNSLDISVSSLSTSGIRMLCNSLAVRISTLTVLSLLGCKLDDECVNILSNVLSCTNITRLNLSANRITNVGVNYLCSVLKRGNCRVKVLYLWDNDKITNKCVKDVRKQIPDVKLYFEFSLF